MWLPYRRNHPPLEGARALLQVDRVPATVWVSYDYAPPYQDLSFQVPIQVATAPQEIGLYIEPAFDGQEHALRLSAQVEGYAPGEPVTLTSTDYWTQWSGASGAIQISLAAGTEPGSGYTTSASDQGTLAGETGARMGEGTTAGDTTSGSGEDTGSSVRTVSFGAAWLLGAGACGATFLGIAALVVILGASSRRRRREAARRPTGDDWSTGGLTADYYGEPNTEYGGGSDVGMGSAGWPESGAGIEGWDDPGAGGSGGWSDTSAGIEGWDEPGGGGSDSWGHA
jgi:hypothetical protein